MWIINGLRFIGRGIIRGASKLGKGSLKLVKKTGSAVGKTWTRVATGTLNTTSKVAAKLSKGAGAFTKTSAKAATKVGKTSGRKAARVAQKKVVAEVAKSHPGARKMGKWLFRTGLAWTPWISYKIWDRRFSKSAVSIAAVETVLRKVANAQTEDEVLNAFGVGPNAPVPIVDPTIDDAQSDEEFVQWLTEEMEGGRVTPTDRRRAEAEAAETARQVRSRSVEFAKQALANMSVTLNAVPNDGVLESAQGRKFDRSLLTAIAALRAVAEAGANVIDDSDVAAAEATGIALSTELKDFESYSEFERLVVQIADMRLDLDEDFADTNALVLSEALGEGSLGMMFER